jgi:Mg2+-importing ATPase
MSDSQFVDAVEKYNVFARITPEQKLRIVVTLKQNGHVVGFMGDGINDAPSLRTADVGISVDSAADVAKGASHIILLKKGLNVICEGVEDGRKIFGNITKYILNTMSANQGNMITIGLSSIFLPFIPMLPTQILLNNLLSDLPLFTISSDNVDKEQLRKPQKWNRKFLFKFMVFFGLISTIFDLLFICVLYFVMGVSIVVFRTAWFLQSVLSEMLIVFSLRTKFPFFMSSPSRLLIMSSIMASLVAFLLVYFTPIGEFFHLEPLEPTIVLVMIAVLIGYFAATEIGKKIFYSRFAD